MDDDELMSESAFSPSSEKKSIKKKESIKSL
jgi:hypothetical protein